MRGEGEGRGGERGQVVGLGGRGREGRVCGLVVGDGGWGGRWGLGGREGEGQR